MGRVELMTRVENLRVTCRDGRCDAPLGLSFIRLTGERHAPSGETDAGERCNISARRGARRRGYGRVNNGFGETKDFSLSDNEDS